MYSNEEIKEFQRIAAELKLKYPACFTEMSAGELVNIINGYGPDSWSEELRKVLTWIFRKYPLPQAIHDLRYEFSDGRELTRKAADAEFAANLRLVWLHNYGVWRFFNPAAWFDYWKINTAAVLTVQFGRNAWRNAYRRNQRKVKYHE